MKKLTLAFTLSLLLAACAPTPPDTTPAIAPTEAATVVPTAMPTAMPTVVPTTESTPVTDTTTWVSQDFIWHSNLCGDNGVWIPAENQPSCFALPMQLDNYYGYAPVTQRVLGSSMLPVLGAGPSQIAVGDLWLIDTTTGQAETLIGDQVVVEAVWAPDGEHFAYVIATDSTYELHWRNLGGEDKLLASDVAFTFSVSPAGDKVAFTRESAYGLPGQPGLYVVDVASGEERLISDADRAGAGSLYDKPVWSPSGQHIFMPTYGTTGGPGLLQVAADGSGSAALQFDPALAEEAWYQAEPFDPIWVSDTQIIALTSLEGANVQMGGDASLVLYQLNDTLDTILDGEVIGQGAFAGWNVPGEFIWVQVGVEMQSVPLPLLEN